MRKVGQRDIELSVVVIVASDTVSRSASASLLEGTLDALAHQEDAPAFEIIVPYHAVTSGIPELRQRFPGVHFLRVPGLKDERHHLTGHEHHHVLRSAGIGHSSGRIVAMTEDHGRPAPDWMRRIVDAHDSRFAAIGGAIENETDRALNWAIYFCDFGRYQRPFTPVEATTISDSNASYKRAALDVIRPAWASGFREPEVNAALAAAGFALFLSPDIVVYQRRGALTFGESLRERFAWGRSYGVQRVGMISTTRRVLYAVLSPLLPVLLTGRIALRAMVRRRTARECLIALPYVIALSAAWTCGEAAGYFSGRVPDGSVLSRQGSPE